MNKKIHTKHIYKIFNIGLLINIIFIFNTYSLSFEENLTRFVKSDLRKDKEFKRNISLLAGEDVGKCKKAVDYFAENKVTSTLIVASCYHPSENIKLVVLEKILEIRLTKGLGLFAFFIHERYSIQKDLSNFPNAIAQKDYQENTKRFKTVFMELKKIKYDEDLEKNKTQDEALKNDPTWNPKIFIKRRRLIREAQSQFKSFNKETKNGTAYLNVNTQLKLVANFDLSKEINQKEIVEILNELDKAKIDIVQQDIEILVVEDGIAKETNDENIGYEIVIVKFTLSGSAHIVNNDEKLKKLKGIKQGRYSIATIAPNGDLIVCMIKKQRQWYWNLWRK